METLRVLDDIRLVLADAPLPFGEANHAAVGNYWAGLSARNPRLWNGPAFMFSEVACEDGVLSATGHPTDFATFLYWRDNGRPRDTVHITGTSLPVTRDGALFAVRMAAHTANSGRIYFPAGSFEEADIRDGMFDATANIGRELEEETGFVLDGTLADDFHVAAFAEGCIHIARRNRLPHDFSGCRAALGRHQASTGDDELDGAVAIRPGDGSSALLRPYARLLADWHFANPPG